MGMEEMLFVKLILEASPVPVLKAIDFTASCLNYSTQKGELEVNTFCWRLQRGLWIGLKKMKGETFMKNVKGLPTLEYFDTFSVYLN